MAPTRGFLLTFAMAIDAVEDRALGMASMLTSSEPARGSPTQAACLVVDPTKSITVIGTGALQGGALARAKAMMASAALNVDLALLCLRNSVMGTTALLAPSHSSFCSTGFVAGSALLGSPYLTALCRSGRDRGAGLAGLFAVDPLTAAAVLADSGVLTLLAPSTVVSHETALHFDRAASQSGIERASWIAAALQNSVDIGRLGTGLGGVRASSVAPDGLANLGAPSWQVLVLIRSSADADLGLATRDAWLRVLLAIAMSRALADIGPGLPCLAITDAARAFAPRPIRAVAFKESTA